MFITISRLTLPGCSRATGSAIGPPKIVHDQGDVLQVERFDPSPEAARVRLGRVFGVERPLGEAESQVVRRETAVGILQPGDEVPPLEGPRGRTVHEDYWSPPGVGGALVKIVECPFSEGPRGGVE